MANVLVIDDDQMVCNAITAVVQRLGHEVHCTTTLSEGLELNRRDDFDVVLLDVRLPDGSGLRRLDELQQVPSRPEVIVMTGRAEPSAAEEAVTGGAFDYLEKPSSVAALREPLERALQYRQQQRAVDPLNGVDRSGIIGSSRPLLQALELAAQVAGSDANVLLQGETGTGKELFARLIHDVSGRAEFPFVVLDCTVLPDNLVESTLFGHEKGAFTGAVKAKSGLLTQANGGTLFMDEIGELPLDLQKSFLRALQERRFRPVGGRREVSSDFRLVAATNRDLAQMVDQGRFREDLLYRLRSFTVTLPPLRDRLEDLRDLITHQLRRLSRQHDIEPKDLSPDFVAALAHHDWPGNVRELINVLERTLIAARTEPVLFARHLPTEIRVAASRAAVSLGGAADATLVTSERVEELPTLKQVRDQAIAAAEQGYLVRLMQLTGGDIKRSCVAAGLSRPRLYALLKKHKVVRHQS